MRILAVIESNAQRIYCYMRVLAASSKRCPIFRAPSMLAQCMHID